MLNPGDRLGAYEILEHLRAGGMASLYRARRVGAAGFARDVAIKVVHPHLALDPTFTRMFVDEALLAARIQHANVVQVEELGKHSSTYFLVMALVRGHSLAQLKARLEERGERLSSELCVQIAVAVADGLHAAHETRDEHGALLGVVHRDVSPQNILVGDDGHVLLIDFGIAKARGRMRETASGEVRGKVRYMAPEQARGEPLDRRADVFALGLVVWELLAGRRYFGELSDTEVLAKLGRPLELPSVGDAKLDAVLARALAYDASARFATARELRRALVEAMPAAGRLDSEALTAKLRALFDRPGDARAYPSATPTPSDVDPDAATAPPTPRSSARVERAPAPRPEHVRDEPTPRSSARRVALAAALLLSLIATAALVWSARESEVPVAAPERSTPTAASAAAPPPSDVATPEVEPPPPTLEPPAEPPPTIVEPRAAREDEAPTQPVARPRRDPPRTPRRAAVPGSELIGGVPIPRESEL